MRILSLEIHDADGWTLEPMKLNAFNLLVGMSGAGKTRIVRAIERVCAVALGTQAADAAHGSSFAIDFEHDERTHHWDGESQAPATSAAAFSRCVFQDRSSMPSHVARSTALFEEQPQRYRSLEALGADFSLPLHDKAEHLQQLFPEAFVDIEEAFCEAFPSVEELRVERVHTPAYEAPYVAFLAAKEAGVPKAIPFAAMSSGMQRYLSVLVHLSYAPRGTVVLIDQFESSLGINCLPAATRFLLRHAPDLQVILTSHHPYVIQQIPIACWKVVTRKGSHVRVVDATTIPALEEARSRLDRFTRLINLPEYEHGIQA